MRSNRHASLARISLSALLLFCAAAPLAGAAELQPQGPVLVVPGTLPLTGPEASSGIAFKEGYELAVFEVNARGGLAVGGQRLPVALDLVDDRGDKAGAAHAAERLIDKHHAAFMLGTFGNTSVAAQASVAELNHVNYVAASGSSAKIFRRGFRFLFGLQAPVDTMAQTELDWVAERQGAGELPRPARLSVAANTSPAGAEFQQAVLAYAQRGPQAFQIVASGRFDPGWTRTGDLLSKIPMAGADVMLADAPWGSFLALHRTALKQGTCRAAVADGAASDDRGRWTLVSESGTSLLKAVWWNEKLAGNPESSAFVQAFRARYHHAPDWEQALAHEAARALFTAIEQAGTVEAEAVRAKLAALHMRSLVPGGEMSFPAASGQQAHYPFLLLQDMPDGAVTILFPAFAATAALEPGPAGRCRQLAAAR
jgi:branched-chain amino acid transport system substrate-binding protein